VRALGLASSACIGAGRLRYGGVRARNIELEATSRRLFSCLWAGDPRDGGSFAPIRERSSEPQPTGTTTRPHAVEPDPAGAGCRDGTVSEPSPPGRIARARAPIAAARRQLPPGVCPDRRIEERAPAHGLRTAPAVPALSRSRRASRGGGGGAAADRIQATKARFALVAGPPVQPAALGRPAAWPGGHSAKTAAGRAPRTAVGARRGDTAPILPVLPPSGEDS
jgi:hypothetical protein